MAQIRLGNEEELVLPSHAANVIGVYWIIKLGRLAGNNSY